MTYSFVVNMSIMDDIVSRIKESPVNTISNNTIQTTTTTTTADTQTLNHLHDIINQAIRHTPLIGDDVKRILDIVFQICLFMTTSILGMAANIINITVYWKQGIRDSITLGFFVLSISDMFIVTLPLIPAACYIAKFIFPKSIVVFVGIHYVSSAFLRLLAYSYSCTLTAYLSLERCCCVVLPFKVRLIFTRNRTMSIVVSVLIIHVICYIPIFATHRLRWMKDLDSNSTETLRVWLAPNRQAIEAFNSTLMAIITPTVSQVVSICSGIIMINGLRASSKFRQMATSQIKSPDGNFETDEDPVVISSRDTRLVQAMVFLVVILSACNIPYLIVNYAMLVEPELDIGKDFHNTYSVVFSICFILASVNASVNIFVYYNTSSRYRKVYKETFCTGRH